MSSVISYGVSETLMADFQALRETPGSNGNKYQEKTIHQLAQYICCRNYANLTLELSYLNWAIVNYLQQQGGLLHFYWIDEAISPGQVRQTFIQSHQATWLPKNTQLKMGELGLEVSFASQRFVISATRVSLLSAFMELLTTHFPQIIQQNENTLLGVDQKGVKANASALQKQIYEWLKEHLPTAKLQQRFRHLDQWLNNDEQQAQTLGQQRINDDKVLRFWQASANQEGYVKYTSAVDDIVQYKKAIDTVESAYQAAQSDSIDEFAQTLCDDQNVLYNSVDNGQDSLSAPMLTTNPKLMSAKDFNTVSIVVDMHNANLILPLSIYRYSVMGNWQAQLIQASRVSVQKLDELLLSAPELSYIDFSSQLIDVQTANRYTLLCICGLLYQHQSVSCIEVLQGTLQAVLSVEQKQQISAFLEKHMTHQTYAKNDADSCDDKTVSESSMTLSFKQLQQWQMQQPAFNKIFDAAKKALGKNNRTGFKNVSQVDEQLLLDGAQALTTINDAINVCVKANINSKENADNDALDAIYASDLCIFKSELVKRHRGQYE